MLEFPCSIVQKVNINSLTFELDFTFHSHFQITFHFQIIRAVEQ